MKQSETAQALLDGAQAAGGEYINVNREQLIVALGGEIQKEVEDDNGAKATDVS